jgi:SAM-dependent methyltransferase
MPKLLDSEALESSEIVANATMNRGRGIDGPNSYARDLGRNPLDVLEGCLAASGEARWLDLCCGEGRALIQAGQRLSGRGAVRIVGLDLVPMFRPLPPELAETVTLLTGTVASWEPEPGQRFDLITCVHGLYYIGDKLGLLERASSWLRDGGLLLAHLDTDNVRVAEDSSGGATVRRLLREAGFTYDARRGLISRIGGGRARFPVLYIGADDSAGPNRTGQPAVNSHYEMV